MFVNIKGLNYRLIILSDYKIDLGVYNRVKNEPDAITNLNASRIIRHPKYGDDKFKVCISFLS